jgi:hypothetical protein
MSGVLAFLKRTLREHSRSGALVLARTGMAITLLVCLVVFGSELRMIGAAGLQFFNAVIVVNALFITAGGCTYFSSAIAEEKEDGTLPLLRMTRISPLALLLGKGGSRLLDGLLLLAVQIPFTLIGITLGGITWVQVFSAYVALGSYLILLCACGLLAGVLMDRQAKAAVLSAAIIWLLLYGGGMASAILGARAAAPWSALDIFAQLRAIMQTNFDGPVFGLQFQASLSLAGTAFLTAWLLFDRFCSEAAVVQARPGAGRAFKRPEEAERAPVLGLIQWKDTYFLHGGGATVLWKLAGYSLAALWLGMDFFTATSNRVDALSLWGVRVVSCGLLALSAEAVIAVGRMFRVERQDRTLAALMTLPHQSAETLLAAKISGIRQTLRPALVFTITGAVIILFSALTGGREAGNAIAFMAFVISPIGLAIGVPIVWTQGLFLQRLVLHLSLRVRGGAVALGFAIWVLSNLLVGLLLVAVAPIFGVLGFLLGIFFATFPQGFIASRLREKNLRLIEAAAQGE